MTDLNDSLKMRVLGQIEIPILIQEVLKKVVSE